MARAGPIEAFVTALGETLNEPVTVSAIEVGIGTGSDAQAVCIVIEDKEEGQRCWSGPKP